ncbi:hypothetical protein [Acinetobacter gerneri]|uniref:Uncharacterized protein n=1 Tax=Acinetobacter gerneri DSM 14967 = CIP 107464 = MTCC 9824 TaxID=1120926 RepID=N8Y7W9_9GAMM|nr:hypothetical protein [Acinetobacter gerneri]ENV32862.1 hypothetical protein F960_03037 [Acinetobacter gerneri DSM 14967 = CIP 107464 = MTCC 9824]EPR85406.1 hypothetical protein L289_1716 [Acinetobacter gerneri DSM 14967 = CIP 107464 = MTCC 9824]
MLLQILRKQLDESTFCPLCQASMYLVEAEEFEQELEFYECSHCHHQVFQNNQRSCQCENCTSKRKKLIKEARLEEKRHFKAKEQYELSLDQLSFLHKLFLLSLLDNQVQEGQQFEEFIDWEKIKYHHITPNYYFQSQLINQLIKDNVLISKSFSDQASQFYINVRLDGYSEPSLFSITYQLRQWFYENLSMGIPFKSSDEVKNVLYVVLYQEIVQFTQHYCRTWGIQISGNKGFQSFCYQLLDSLAVGQIYYLIQTALEYLYQKKALQIRNENFINTNILKKTLQQYRERTLAEKWETSTLPRPPNIPLSKMSEILFFRFLGYDESIFFQPVWRAWKKIEPRLSFYSVKRCMYCGSNELDVDYDAESYVSLFCRNCKHQDHYFTK